MGHGLHQVDMAVAVGGIRVVQPRAALAEDRAGRGSGKVGETAEWVLTGRGPAADWRTRQGSSPKPDGKPVDDTHQRSGSNCRLPGKYKHSGRARIFPE